jgi:ABC-2 type transport system permease protein
VWYWGIQSLKPSAAYQSALSAVLDGATSMAGVAGIENPPVYLEAWFGFVWLALWLVVPLAVAYARFTRTDL